MQRFPRPRGDGLVIAAVAMDPNAVPPPTRGWPVQASVSAAYPAVPPPTRGWPQHPACCFCHCSGSPAHAGMAPPMWKSCKRWLRFPRPRGDGPAYVEKLQALVAGPPPTRGWPLSRAETIKAIAGSPAHAGMAPQAEQIGHDASGFPRPRGDGPGGGVFRGAYVGFPRPRGDGPCHRARSTRTRTVPPPTRGWPPPIAEWAAEVEGSPAHAGMARRCPRVD